MSAPAQESVHRLGTSQGRQSQGSAGVQPVLVVSALGVGSRAIMLHSASLRMLSVSSVGSWDT